MFKIRLNPSMKSLRSTALHGRLTAEESGRRKTVDHGGEKQQSAKTRLVRGTTLTRRRVGQQQQQEQQEAGRPELHAGRGGGRRVLDSIALSAAAHTAKRRRHEAAAARPGCAPEWWPLSRQTPQRSFTATHGRRRPVCRPSGRPPSHRSALPGPAATRGHGATASTRARRRGGRRAAAQVFA